MLQLMSRLTVTRVSQYNYLRKLVRHLHVYNVPTAKLHRETSVKMNLFEFVLLCESLIFLFILFIVGLLFSAEYVIATHAYITMDVQLHINCDVYQLNCRQKQSHNKAKQIKIWKYHRVKQTQIYPFLWYFLVFILWCKANAM